MEYVEDVVVVDVERVEVRRRVPRLEFRVRTLQGCSFRGSSATGLPPPQTRLTNLPDQWLQCQAYGSIVCRALRVASVGYVSLCLHGVSLSKKNVR